jgi:hypothetical protein
MKITIFWDVAPCSLVEIERRFRGAFLKRPSVFTRLHGTTSQKTVIFIPDAHRLAKIWLARYENHYVTHLQ